MGLWNRRKIRLIESNAKSHYLSCPRLFFGLLHITPSVYCNAYIYLNDGRCFLTCKLHLYLKTKGDCFSHVFRFSSFILRSYSATSYFLFTYCMLHIFNSGLISLCPKNKLYAGFAAVQEWRASAVS